MLILYQSSTSFRVSWGIPRRGALSGEISSWGVENMAGKPAGDGQLACIFTVKTIGRPIISRDSTVCGTSGKIFLQQTTTRFENQKCWTAQRFRNPSFLVKRRPSQTYQQNAWVRCWSCNLRYQITMRSDNMSATLSLSLWGDGCLWSSRDIPVLLGIGIFPWHFRALGDGLEAMK